MLPLEMGINIKLHLAEARLKDSSFKKKMNETKNKVK